MKKLFPFIILATLFCSCDTTSKLGKAGDPVFTGPIGVQAYSFRNYFPKDVPGTLDRIQEMGITQIEGDGGRIPPEEYKKMCKARGISIPSTGTSFKELDEDPEAIVTKAKALGAKYVMCAWVPHEDDFDIEDAKRAVAVFNKGGKVLADNGITFCYHPHGYEFAEYGDARLMDYILEHTNPEHVSYEMDVFWCYHGGGDPVSYLNKYPDRWKMLHLKDMKAGTPRNTTGNADDESNVPLGTGVIDIEGIMKTSRKIGIVYYFIEDESSEVMSQVPESVAYLRSLKF
ncbi:MAG: sugar phosphate isomerase/epimerase [Saprospiraceae bacterium]|nr:sugar phosphate isomerase/epimerase [Saprospiraceae bacterium]